LYAHKGQTEPQQRITKSVRMLVAVVAANQRDQRKQLLQIIYMVSKHKRPQLIKLMHLGYMFGLNIGFHVFFTLLAACAIN